VAWLNQGSIGSPRSLVALALRYLGPRILAPHGSLRRSHPLGELLVPAQSEHPRERVRHALINVCPGRHRPVAIRQRLFELPRLPRFVLQQRRQRLVLWLQDRHGRRCVERTAKLGRHRRWLRHHQGNDIAHMAREPAWRPRRLALQTIGLHARRAHRALHRAPQPHCRLEPLLRRGVAVAPHRDVVRLLCRIAELCLLQIVRRPIQRVGERRDDCLEVRRGWRFGPLRRRGLLGQCLRHTRGVRPRCGDDLVAHLDLILHLSAQLGHAPLLLPRGAAKIRGALAALQEKGPPAVLGLSSPRESFLRASRSRACRPRRPS